MMREASPLDGPDPSAEALQAQSRSGLGLHSRRVRPELQAAGIGVHELSPQRSTRDRSSISQRATAQSCGRATGEDPTIPATGRAIPAIGRE